MHKTNPPKGQVHFGESVKATRENSVLIQESSPGCIHVHLGFLRFQHNYEIALNIPKEYFLGYCLNEITRAVENSTPNLNCRLVSIEEKADYFYLLVEFCARKEKLLEEELNLNVDSKSMKLIFIARVLGEGKGTPLLKNEIKCVGAEVDEISEASDWAGFD